MVSENHITLSIFVTKVIDILDGIIHEASGLTMRVKQREKGLDSISPSEVYYCFRSMA